MLGTTKPHVVVIAVSIAVQLAAGKVHAQQPAFRQRLAALQEQNAYQQQQAAVQLAVQQTSRLVQTALRQGDATQPSGFLQPLDFQQQASALQMALQTTTALQQAASRSSRTPGQAPLLQISAVQAALQMTTTLQTASQIQNGQLTDTQIQTLFGEQSSLMGLLTVPPPQSPGKSRSQ